MSNTSDANGGLYFIVGALVIAVAVMGYFYFDGSNHASGPSIAIEKTTTTNNITKPADLKLDITRH